MPKFLQKIERAVIRKDRKLLQQQYPSAFKVVNKQGLKQPLKLGIHKEVLERGLIDPETNEPLPALRVKAAIWSYCSSPEYYAAVSLGGQRVDINGQPVEDIVEAQILHAREYLKRYNRNMAAKRKAAAKAA